MARHFGFQNVDQWMRFRGAPIQVSQPDQWLKGPFFFDIVFVLDQSSTATAGQINVLDSAILNTDPQFQATYGYVQNPEVVLHWSGAQLIAGGDDFRLAPPADKGTIWQNAELAFRKGQRNVNYPLGQTLREMLGAFSSASATAEHAPFTGFGPYRIPNSIEVNTINDALVIPSLGTDLAGPLNAQLVQFGYIFPSKSPRDANVVGATGSCGPSDGVSDLTVATQQVLARPALLAGDTIGPQASGGMKALTGY